MKIAFIGFTREIKAYASAIAQSVNGITIVGAKEADIVIVNNNLSRYRPGLNVITFVGVKNPMETDFAEIGHNDIWAPITSFTGTELRCRLEGLVRRFNSFDH